MGCICSVGQSAEISSQKEKEKDSTRSSVQLIAPSFPRKEDLVSKPRAPSGLGTRDVPARSSSRQNGVIVRSDEGNKRPQVVEGPSKSQQRRPSAETGAGGGRGQRELIRMRSMPYSPEAELAGAGWPSWLSSVAGEAIKGWVPRRAESFEKLDKIGQGTYSSVYKARDLETGKIVAMKKVRFVNMDPESVRFMAREIHILRKLDHTNVMKLEGLVTSRLSGSLYLVFEYMEHDLTGLAANPVAKFTESQIKCYMQQLFRGLEHCHRRGILHRDIKGSNLLINNDGVLKIGDFGLANFCQPEPDQPLTSHVVTLWYRAPELLLGATDYGAAIDLWSAGCILAELYAGKPIMPGRTEVEQMHKIFKLCGSPSEDHWHKTKQPLATSYKPQQPYKRVVLETYKNFPPSALTLVDKLLAMEPEKRGSAASALRSEFFTTGPLPSDPSSLPKYTPSKELDAKRRNEDAKRKKSEGVMGHGAETVRRGPRDIKGVATPVFGVSAQSKVTCISHKFKTEEESGTGFRIEPPRRTTQNGYMVAASIVHPSVAGSSWNKSGGSARHTGEARTKRSQTGDLACSSTKKETASKDSAMGYVPKKNRIHLSGPLVPPGGNIDDILKEHERQIQQAVRKARLEKSATKKNQNFTSQKNQTRRYAQ